MIILPAIDIKGGKCVRLYKGDFATAETVAPDPLETASKFQSAGAQWLHLVDLDGAKSGTRENAEIFLTIARQNPALKIELGGGIRDLDSVEFYLSGGLSRVILGTAAVKNPELVKTAVREFGEKIAVGVDARGGKVSTEGWLSDGGTDFVDLSLEMAAAGVRTFIFTDIDRDGTLGGVNVAETARLQQTLREKYPEANVVASGGVRDIADIKALSAAGIYGAICGKSIYSGGLDLAEALAASDNYGGDQ